MDHDAEVIHEAALLDDFAEMLLWRHAPALALAIPQRLRSRTRRCVQRQCNATFSTQPVDVQQGLMRAWRLPESLVRISDDHHAHTAQVRNG